MLSSYSPAASDERKSDLQDTMFAFTFFCSELRGLDELEQPRDEAMRSQQENDVHFISLFVWVLLK